MTRRTIALSAIGVVGVAALSYVGGFDAGKKKMSDFCGEVTRAASAGDHVSLFTKHMAALAALRNSNLPETEAALRSLARTDADRIVACKKEPRCPRLSGTTLTDDEQLQKALK